jgi:hypothetical protein
VLGPNGSSRFEVAKMGRPSSPMRAGLAPRASCRRRSMAPISPARVASGSRSAILPASPCSGSGARFGIGDHREVIELGNRQTNDFTRSRIHNGQSMKMGSSLAPTRRHFEELSDDDLTPTCLGRADRDLGFCRSVLGGGGSRVVRVRHYFLDLGLQPLTQRFAFWPTIRLSLELDPPLTSPVTRRRGATAETTAVGASSRGRRVRRWARRASKSPKTAMYLTSITAISRSFS